MSLGKRVLCVVPVVALLLMLLGSPVLAVAAQNIYLKIEGQKQGAFKGKTTRKGGQWIPVVAFSHGIVSPRDTATGQASGKRQHKPVVIRKEVDSASPQIFRAVADNEMIREAVIEFVRSDPRGKEEVYQTITLTGAHIVSVRKTGAAGGGRDRHEEEEISITYEKIEVTDKMGNKTATDDWTK